MRWKLACLAAISLVLIGSTIPIRTHAVGYNLLTEAPPPPPTLLDIVSSIYFPTATLVEIGLIFSAAVLLAVRIVHQAKTKI